MIPRLRTLGAIVCFAVLTNVFMLNLCSGVPVKLLSFHLLLMSLFLQAPELPRITDLLVFHRAVSPTDLPALSSQRWINRGVPILHGILGLIILLFILRRGMEDLFEAGGGISAKLQKMPESGPIARRNHTSKLLRNRRRRHSIRLNSAKGAQLWRRRSSLPATSRIARWLARNLSDESRRNAWLAIKVEARPVSYGSHGARALLRRRYPLLC
jgi:hypothetical protein